MTELDPNITNHPRFKTAPKRASNHLSTRNFLVWKMCCENFATMDLPNFKDHPEEVFNFKLHLIEQKTDTMH